MDIETENVINLVFPESIPGRISLATWKLIVNILLNNVCIVYIGNYILYNYHFRIMERKS